MFEICKIGSVGSIRAIKKLNSVENLRNCVPLWQMRILTKSGNLIGEGLSSADPSLSCTGLETVYDPPK